MSSLRRPPIAGREARELWPSWMDLAGSAAVICFVLALIAYLHDLVAAQRVSAYDEQINAAERALATLREELDRARAEEESAALRSSETGGARVAAASIVDRTIADAQRPSSSGAWSKSPVIAAIGALPPFVRAAADGRLSMEQTALFRPNSVELNPGAREVLAGIARAYDGALQRLDGCHANVSMVVEGTDDAGASPVERSLSARRSAVVLETLLELSPRLAGDGAVHLISGSSAQMSSEDTSPGILGQRVELRLFTEGSEPNCESGHRQG